MQYLNTFWKTVVSKIPYLSLKLRERDLSLNEVWLWEQLREREQKLLLHEEVVRELLSKQVRFRELFLEQLRERERKLLSHEEVVRELKLLSKEVQCRELLLKQELELFYLKAPNSSSVEVRQKSHIKGWLSKILLEEWRGELEALRYSWLNESKSEIQIKIMTGFCLLDMLKAYLQIKVEDRWLFKRKQS